MTQSNGPFRTTRRNTVAGLAALSFIPNAALAKRKRAPNVVLVVADDIGYGALRCYGPNGRVPSPAADRMASQGLRFSDAHSASSVCTPSRYAFLTGRYAWRTGMTEPVLKPWDPPIIEPGRPTLATMLRSAGYATACIGKWHLGWDWPKSEGRYVFDQPIGNGPTTRGFDYYFGVDVANYPPYVFIENDRTLGIPTEELRPVTPDPDDIENEPGPKLANWKFEDVMPRLLARTLDYLDQAARNQNQPFFLYLPLTSPHEPVMPSKDFAGRTGIGPVADFMVQTDAALGAVLDRLEALGVADDTLVIYTSDNGQSDYLGFEEFEKAGHKVNGPLRSYKGSIYEGGHRIPLVMRWPNGISGIDRVVNDLVGLVDLPATIAELVGERSFQRATQDSISFAGILRGGRGRRRTLVNHSAAGQFAIRDGRWKLVRPEAPVQPEGSYWTPEAKAPELYDLKADIAESRNLASAQPERVARMTRMLDALR
jgi:arylsulfatase A